MKQTAYVFFLLAAFVVKVEAQSEYETQIENKCFKDVVTRQTIFFERFVLKKIYQDEIQKCSNELITQQHLKTLDKRYIESAPTDASYRSSVLEKQELSKELKFDQSPINDSPPALGYQQLTSNKPNKESLVIKTVDGYTSLSER